MQVSAAVLRLLYSLIHPKETEIVVSLDPQKLQARGCHPSGSSGLILVGKSCVKHAFAISAIGDSMLATQSNKTLPGTFF
jgi:hypothetical protein